MHRDWRYWRNLCSGQDRFTMPRLGSSCHQSRPQIANGVNVQHLQCVHTQAVCHLPAHIYLERERERETMAECSGQCCGWWSNLIYLLKLRLKVLRILSLFRSDCLCMHNVCSHTRTHTLAHSFTHVRQLCKCPPCWAVRVRWIIR